MDYSDGLSVSTRVSEGGRESEPEVAAERVQLYPASFEDGGRGLMPRNAGSLSRRWKSFHPKSLPKECSPANTLILAQWAPFLDIWPPELQHNTFMLYQLTKFFVSVKENQYRLLKTWIVAHNQPAFRSRLDHLMCGLESSPVYSGGLIHQHICVKTKISPWGWPCPLMSRPSKAHAVGA